VEGMRIVLVWACTETGRKENCVGLGMYREWKERELFWFGHVQSGRKENCVGLGMYREWKERELCWFGHVQRVEGKRIPKSVLYMNLETTRLRARPRNRWQNEMTKDERIGGGNGWQKQYITDRNGRSS
jgi:hypothetical protein